MWHEACVRLSLSIERCGGGRQKCEKQQRKPGTTIARFPPKRQKREEVVGEATREERKRDKDYKKGSQRHAVFYEIRRLIAV